MRKAAHCGAKGEAPVSVCVVYEGLVNNHFCPKPGVLTDKSAKLSEVQVCPVHPVQSSRTTTQVRVWTKRNGKLIQSQAYIGATLSS